ALERALARGGVSGSLPTGRGDFLSVVQDNGGGNKVDFYLRRSVSYTVRLGGDGTGLATARVRLANAAPTSGEPAYVIGPYPGGAAAGENVSFVNLYAARGARLGSALRDGTPQP